MDTQKQPLPSFKTKQLGTRSSLLYNGSQFVGHQKTEDKHYDVDVTIQHVNIEDSYLCGYLRFKGVEKGCYTYPGGADAAGSGRGMSPSAGSALTQEGWRAPSPHPASADALTTFFVGEIISKKHPFHTRKGSDNSSLADEAVDRTFWSKFSSFRNSHYLKSFNSDHFDYDNLRDNSDYVYMRWKEQFLVPDHNVQDVPGWSFAGFYYVCFQKSTGAIEGYYYSQNSRTRYPDFDEDIDYSPPSRRRRTCPKCSSLHLTHIPERSHAIYEFR